MSEDIVEKTLVTPIPGMNREKEKHSYIIFLQGPMMGKLFLLEEGTITLGRGADVDVPINDLGISRRHISIQMKKGKVTLKDLESTNGTFVNNKNVKEAILRDGDKIQLSTSTILKYAYQDNEEKIYQEELYKMGVVDALTGTYNKRYFEERMREEFSYCLRNSVPLSLAMFDIDHFKGINDTHGHQAGDYVLSHVATLAKSIIRNEDILARFGGEEFMTILKATDAAGAQMLTERLRRLIDESRFEFEGKPIHVTISIGVVTLSGKNLSDCEQMIRQADVLMYQSKNTGRNRVSV